LDIKSNNLANTRGTLVAGNKLDIEADNTLTNKQGTLYSGNTIDIKANDLQGTEGTIIAKGRLDVTIANTLNVNDGYIEANGTNLKADTLQANSANILSYDTLGIQTQTIQANNSTIQALDDIAIIATNTLNQNDNSMIYSGGDITINTPQSSHFS